jgi:hypothetical protein
MGLLQSKTISSIHLLTTKLRLLLIIKTVFVSALRMSFLVQRKSGSIILLQQQHFVDRYAVQYERSRLFAGVGNDGSLPPPNDKSGDKNGNNSWEDFLNSNYKESENMRKAREYMSENSLPITYNSDNTKDMSEKADDDEGNEADGDEGNEDDNDKSSLSSAITRRQGETYSMSLTAETVINNPYIGAVSKLTPSELISKFTASAHPRVQNAVRTTILGMLGGLSKLSIETTTITTGQKLASLMFQLQMTGYMFKVCESGCPIVWFVLEQKPIFRCTHTFLNAP